MSYDKEKIKQFHKYTIEDYNKSSDIEDIVKVKLVEKADDSFTQIEIRPLVDEDMFILPNFHPELPGAGRIVAMGERDFLIKYILDQKEIDRIEFKEDIKEFPKHIFNEAVILLSTKFYVEVFTKLIHRIDYEEKYPRLDYQYRIVSVPEKVLGNKIIVIDKRAILWEKQLFDNKVTEKRETIHIDIKSVSSGKVDITIRSVNKIKHIDPNLIKILEVKK